MAIVSQKIGPISAYAIAKEEGYTGTKEEFATEIANASINAQAAAASATAAEGYATSAATSASNAMSTTPEGYNSMMASIAAEYDAANGVYAVGDYCRYNSELYRCMTAITSPEAWTATHWEKIVIGEDLSRVTGSLSTIAGGSAVPYVFALKRYDGFINADGLWSLGATRKFTLIPAIPGASYSISGNAANYAIAFLDGFPSPVNGETPNYCSSTPSKILVNANTVTGTVPNDCKYIYSYTLNTDNVVMGPSAFVMDGYDYADTIVENIKTANAASAVLDSTVLYRGSFNTLLITNCIDFTATGYAVFTTSNLENMTDKPDGLDKSGILFNYPVAGGGRFQSIQSLGKMWFRNISSNDNPQPWIKVNAVDTTLAVSDVAADSKTVGDAFIKSLTYLGTVSTLDITQFSAINETGFVQFSLADSSTITDRPANLTSGGICVNYQISTTKFQIVQSVRKMWYRNIPSSGVPTEWVQVGNDYYIPKWYALGDSITEGVYSEIGGSGGVGITSDNYVNLIAKYENYDIVNLGEGGMGYLRPGNDSNKNAKDICDETDFADADLITLGLGTNDWGSYDFGTVNDATSANTVCGAMKYCIETIMQKHPSAKIVAISPMNNYRHGGTYETNWAMNYDRGHGTLSQFLTVLESVCDYYGIQFINMYKTAPVNRQNISTLLGDGLHPTRDGYVLIAKALHKAILI